MADSAIPNFYETRLSLSDISVMISSYIGDNTLININETIRLMLGDYFYGEIPITYLPTSRAFDRTIVWPITGQTIFGAELQEAFLNMGEVFWNLADMITRRVLWLSDSYQHPSSNCFYKFFPDTCTLVTYVPIVLGVTSPLVIPIPASAVVLTCASTLPTMYKA